MKEISFVMNQEDLFQAISNYIFRARSIEFSGEGRIEVHWKIDEDRKEIIGLSGKIKYDNKKIIKMKGG